MAQNNYNKNPFDLSRVLTQHWRVVSDVLSLLVITRGQWHSGYLHIKWLMLLVISHIGGASYGKACEIDTLR
jgi:hypothetical protein